ncbi:YihA family ribosome biogenesis GTP-binding protein [Heliorestis acidaminivorans]|uniref:Probable GTP-binding protein EngB n=1 Tax=Heliorestis acidaminivorans TaxID=553427 RepID=A0A6I0EZW9_9FIRM|nr:ribosome biogenesis GTP-binding protein YihA/YsxC [Heliorestis acidaminivorans]KAB2952591.1 YihA family ribosome biogenesis GTP-binding protein [Heliorestis acidaminivorans]
MEERNEEAYRILESEYVISAVAPAQYPELEWPEVALVGRSNVGKSSLINKICNRKNLARTSSRPGKTQTLNFYRINNEVHLVDLPGYGYANVPKSLKSTWGKMMEQYLKSRAQLRGVLQLIDIRHSPTKDDVAMNEWLAHFQIATAVIITKADKISKGRYAQHVKEIRQTLNIAPHIPTIIFSAQTGEGKEDVIELLDHLWHYDEKTESYEE